MASPLIRRFGISRIHGSESEATTDTVAAEEPLEIHVLHWFKDVPHAETLAVTMRTPGNDRELAAGLLVSEGIIQRACEISGIRNLGPGSSNEMLVELAKGADFEGWRAARTGFMSSSCGICGKRSREFLESQLPKAAPDEGFRVRADLIAGLPTLLAERQVGFETTGGLHAAALIDPATGLVSMFEDIGRHNALDKLIGWAFLNGKLPLARRVVFMSSRSSFELIQKAAMAGAPVLATIGGPSSLAIDTARQCGMTLAGFIREGRFNIYSGEWRIHSK